MTQSNIQVVSVISGVIGSLSSSVFERRTSTGSELFSFLICLDATKFVWLSVFTLIETTCPKICSKSQLKCAKSPLPVDVRRTNAVRWLGILQSYFLATVIANRIYKGALHLSALTGQLYDQ